MIANVRRFSTSARKSMTVRNSTALRTTFAVLAIFSAAVFWGGNAIASKILYQPGGAHFDAPGLFVARAAWSLPLFLLMAFLARPKRPPSRADWLLLAGNGRRVRTGRLRLPRPGRAIHQRRARRAADEPFTAGHGRHRRAAAARTRRCDPHRRARRRASPARCCSPSRVRRPDRRSSATCSNSCKSRSYSMMFVLTRALGKRYSAFFVSGTYGVIGMGLLVLFGLVSGRLCAVDRANAGARIARRHGGSSARSSSGCRSTVNSRRRSRCVISTPGKRASSARTAR